MFKLTSVLFMAVAISASAQAPVAPVKPVMDDYHGIKVSDPYRYMEKLDDPTVKSWFKGQNDYTRSALARIPGRDKLVARIKELDQSVPQIAALPFPGDLYLMAKELPGDNTFKIYTRHGLSGEDAVLVDPEKVRLASTVQSKGKNTLLFRGLSSAAVSSDQKYLAVCVLPGGSELDGEVHVFNMATGRETGDVITKMGAEAWDVSWLPDNHSFVYGHIQQLPAGAPPAEVRQKFRAYRHVLGTDPAKDKAVFGYGVVPSISVEPSEISSIQIPSGSAWALGLVNGSVTPNSAYYVAPASSIGQADTPWRKVADMSDGVTNIVVHGDELYALTYKDAPRYKVMRLDARHPDFKTAPIALAEGAAVITDISAAQDAIYVTRLDGGVGRLLRLQYGGSPQPEPVTMPFEGSAYALTHPLVPGALLSVASWTKGFQEYQYDPSTKQVTNTKFQPVGPYDNPENIESVEVKAKSYDGTLVPLSILYRKDIKLDGSNPAGLYGYGGYGDSLSPFFDPKHLAWFETAEEFMLSAMHAAAGSTARSGTLRARWGPSPIPGKISLPARNI